MFKVLLAGGIIALYAIVGIASGFSWKAHAVAAVGSMVATVILGQFDGARLDGRGIGMMVLGNLILAVVLVLLTFSAQSITEARSFKARAHVVQGRVYAVIRHSEPDGPSDDDLYSPRIEFTDDRTGQVGRFDSGTSANPPKYSVGDPVALLMDEKGSVSVAEFSGLYINGAIAGGMGVLMLGFAIVLVAFA